MEFECNCKKCMGETPEYPEPHEDNCQCAECYAYHDNEHSTFEYAEQCVWCQEDALAQAENIYEQEKLK